MVDLVYNSDKIKVQNTKEKPQLAVLAQKAVFLGSYYTENLKSKDVRWSLIRKEMVDLGFKSYSTKDKNTQKRP